LDVRFVREKAGLTQAQMAEELGVTRSAVGHWESGLSAPDSDQRALLAALWPGRARASVLWPGREGRVDQYPSAPAGGKPGSVGALERRVFMARRNAAIGGFDSEAAEVRARADFADARPSVAQREGS
jgi:hypothetical protein